MKVNVCMRESKEAETEGKKYPSAAAKNRIGEESEGAAGE